MLRTTCWTQASKPFAAGSKSNKPVTKRWTLANGRRNSTLGCEAIPRPRLCSPTTQSAVIPSTAHAECNAGPHRHQHFPPPSSASSSTLPPRRRKWTHLLLKPFNQRSWQIKQRQFLGIKSLIPARVIRDSTTASARSPPQSELFWE